MVALGDHLPEERRAELVDSQLTPGRIVRTTLRLQSGTTKVKYLLVARVGLEVLGLVINSSMTDFQANNAALRECQVPIGCETDPCLDHDSYIDCSYAHYEDAGRIRAQLIADIGGLKDMISADRRTAVLHALEASFVLEQTAKRQLIEAFSTVE